MALAKGGAARKGPRHGRARRTAVQDGSHKVGTSTRVLDANSLADAGTSGSQADLQAAGA